MEKAFRIHFSQCACSAWWFVSSIMLHFLSCPPTSTSPGFPAPPWPWSFFVVVTLLFIQRHGAGLDVDVVEWGVWKQTPRTWKTWDGAVTLRPLMSSFVFALRIWMLMSGWHPINSVRRALLLSPHLHNSHRCRVALDLNPLPVRGYRGQ